MVSQIDAHRLKACLHDGGEIALLDAREEVPFDARHLLMAACVPLSRLEMLVDEMVPRRSVRVVWCDDGEGLAERAASRMAALGYGDVSVLQGGVAAWEAAGYRIYSGVHVPSKAFAEVVEHEAGTPWISAEQLKDWLDSRADIALLDSRSYEEYHDNSIPGAISVPGAELVYRFADLVPSPDTTVVVNCGGRTRSIIGAQSLINAGVPNKVVSLKDGTQAWHLAGFQVLKGATAQPPAVSEAGRAAARAAAARVAARGGISTIDPATLERWRAEQATRSLYVFDVRTPAEFAAGHVPGMKHVAGGQLVQETDRHVATWGARVVLVDDDGVRATMTAHWMQQMGWDVAVLTLDMRSAGTATGAYAPRVLGLDDLLVPSIAVVALRDQLQAGTVVVVDLNWSRSFAAGHIPGAWYAIRARLEGAFGALPATAKIVFTSSDGALARLAAAEWNGRAPAAVFALSGGTKAWVAAGLGLEPGATRMASAPDDMRLRAREQAGSVEDAMRAYLAWEIDLVNQMAMDDDHRFKVLAG
ncbi:MAG TPA: rhodanese-like domain-containing protein [Acetobacteraceae bacterium]|jgi:rhodanese-related sulfurtransferase|nr:rhodanese-like domain-containing protein [Acetobacteraceae bacterium]